MWMVRLVSHRIEVQHSDLHVNVVIKQLCFFCVYLDRTELRTTYNNCQTRCLNLLLMYYVNDRIYIMKWPNYWTSYESEERMRTKRRELKCVDGHVVTFHSHFLVLFSSSSFLMSEPVIVACDGSHVQTESRLK